MNVVILTGFLTKKPILKEIDIDNNKTKVALSSIAVNKKWKTENNEIKEKVMFIDITIWGNAAENAIKFLKTGSKVSLQGELIMEQWLESENTPNEKKRIKHIVNVKSIEYLDKIEENNEKMDNNFLKTENEIKDSF